MYRFLHVLFPALLIAVSATAMELPRPLQPDDFPQTDPAKAKLGQLLFYDKILSGNRNISCGTCHHHDLGGSDGLSLGIGEGGAGLGPKRTPGDGPSRILARVPRNAPALWNLAHQDISVLFHDGRLEISDIYGNGFASPAEERLPKGLDNIIAAQALFPVTSRDEMAGEAAENEVGGATNDRIDYVWPILAERIRAIPEYPPLFEAAFEDVETPADIEIVHVANALAAFIGSEWQNHDSPFDQYLAGNETALKPHEIEGLELFYGKANCASCHSGPLMSDQSFHAIALPQFGPGKTRKFDLLPRDTGRMVKSDRLEDAYRFRTPMLRNVALTAPYGHNGAYSTLEGIVRHHLDPVGSLDKWTPEEAHLANVPWLQDRDFIVMQDQREALRHRHALDIEPVSLTDKEVANIVAFLECLTGETAESRPLGRPERVPSGLPVD